MDLLQCYSSDSGSDSECQGGFTGSHYLPNKVAEKNDVPLLVPPTDERHTKPNQTVSSDHSLLTALPAPQIKKRPSTGVHANRRFKHRAPNALFSAPIDYGERDLRVSDDDLDSEIQEGSIKTSERAIEPESRTMPDSPSSLPKARCLQVDTTLSHYENDIMRHAAVAYQSEDPEKNGTSALDFSTKTRNDWQSKPMRMHSKIDAEAADVNVQELNLEAALEAEAIRYGEPVPKFKEIHGKSLRGNFSAYQPDASVSKGAYGSDYEVKLRSEAGRMGSISKLAKRRHQLTSLYAHAKEQELEQLERRALSAKTKSETQRKYGW